ncbi:hypothetical protein Ccrd_009138 [Cynara cardunculus var. scolymus]|uniref:Uncharacterized protein n=1 Tax=Cynara cardunculus var. scolymus TaxID=59895 RepID=A0A103YNS2_CYNCS|nr:hypothetical protein Ccrd_009138 [Cynara cardunculus var. scolymus]
MDTSNVLKWASFTLFLVFHPQIERPLVATVPIPPFAPRPLCNFQLALANQACAYLPSSLVSPPPPPPPFAAVDDECVCELLGRLPPFLARPIHEYTVRVAGSCNTTYSCGPGLLRL